MKKQDIIEAVSSGLKEQYGISIQGSEFEKQLVDKLTLLENDYQKARRIERVRFILSCVETDEQALAIIEAIESKEDEVMIHNVSYEFQGETKQVIPWEVFENYYNCREFLETIE